MTDQTERRSRRSGCRQQALTYQLQHVQQAYGLERITFADDSGLLIGSGRAKLLDGVVASYAQAILNTRRERRERLTRELWKLVRCTPDHRIEVREVQVEGRAGFICAVGKESAAINKAFDHSLDGIGRITATTAA